VILPPVDPSIEQRAPQKPPPRDDTHFAAGKIAVFQYSAVIILLILISGFWKLQVQNPQFYDERAQQNSIKSVPIPAPRGRILDRDGRVIVDNHSSFMLLLARELLKEDHLTSIAQGLDLDYNDLVAKVQRFRSQPKYVPIIVKEEMTPADLAFVESHRDFFPEMEVIQAQRRLYPQNGMMAHVIGYTGEVSEEELDSPEFAKYNPGNVIGKFGIEREYNDTLMGVDGQRQVIVDSRGQVRGEPLRQKEAIPGKDLQLTIDLDLQAVAELAMDGRNGAVVALDVRTGEVLAMVSRPTFDPNKFTARIKAKDWKEIADNPDHPLLNRAIQAQQAPGSTFKPIVALAGLETGTVDDKWTVHCSGGVALYGRFQKCWVYPRGHGTISLVEAIAHSCDVFFYTLGAKLGIDNIATYGDMVGYGKKTGIDLPHEAEGIMPSTKWKLRNYRQKWYAGETPSVAIGQGALTVTPLQMAHAFAGIAAGGKWHTPHLVKSLQEKPTVVALNPDNVQKVVDGMYGVVNEMGGPWGPGTGIRAHLPNTEVCGKTGSAQIASNEFTKGKSGKEYKDNAWFVGFAPREAPEIVVVAFYEHGEHGQFAAPIVRDVIKAYFDKKIRLAAAMQKEGGATSGQMGALSNFGLTPGARAQAATDEGLAVSDADSLAEDSVAVSSDSDGDKLPPAASGPRN
jgi:penicillin-binding protein 2